MGQQRRDLHGLPEALDPAIGVLLLDWPPTVFAQGRFRSATLQLHDPQRQPALAQGQRTVQAQPSAFGASLVGSDLAQSLALAARGKVQISGVLHDQRRALPAHPAEGSGAMALEELSRIQFGAASVEQAIVAFESVAMAPGGLGIGPVGLSRLVAGNLDQAAGQTLISQFTVPKFGLRPTRAIQATLHAQGTHRGWFDPNSILQLLDQRIEINVLDALGGVIEPVASAAFGLAHPNPVSGLVARTRIGRG